MRIIAEEVEGAIYQDVILSDLEILALLDGEMIEGESMIACQNGLGIKFQRCCTGIRIGEEWKYSSTIEAERDLL